MKKQVVFIMTDTTRKDMLGCYGNTNMRTPNLDQLAKDGIKYENAYTCQPVCGPARSAIFTGMFPHTNGMVTNTVALRENVKTIGQRLADHEIKCGYIGKWHLDGGDYFGNGVCPKGFDPKYWYDMKCYLDELTEEERVASRCSQTSYSQSMTEEFTFAHRCCKRALSFLEENKDNDFFLTVSLDEPHDPCLCPAPFNTMYKGYKLDSQPNFQDDLSKKPFLQQLWAGKNIHKSEDEINGASDGLALFLGCNSFADYEIGKVIDKVNELVPNALIIYTSDHGDMLGSHRLQGKNAAAYKEIANIPLIIKGGEKNKTVTEPATHIDLMPTILNYMGIEVPKTLEGKSILKQIYNTEDSMHDVVFTEFTRYEVDHDGFGGLQMMRAAISKRYKLVINLLDTDEFYDLQSDPYEINNLIMDENYKSERNHLHDLLLDHMNQTRDLYRGYQWSYRPWRQDKYPGWNNDGYTRQRETEEGENRQLDYATGLEMKDSIRKK